MEPRPLPAFYCVYLLRSIPRPGSLYVGSTPHPARRLAQHNGRLPGGAARTARRAHRPWRAACLVAGFPSALAALQFEWAWAHAHLTRHIRDVDRVARATPGAARISRKTGRRTTRPGKTREGLREKVRELRLLAGGASFGRLGLEVRVLDEELWRVWEETADGDVGGGARWEIRAVRDFEEGQEAKSRGITHEELERRHLERVRRIDHTYASVRDHLLKALGRLEVDEPVRCSVCQDEVSPPGHMAVFCHHADCTMAAHISCLARKFLQAEPGYDALLPVRGTCPECRTELRWSDLVREMTLRVRDQKQVAKLRKKPRKRKGPAELTSSPSKAAGGPEEENEDPPDEADWMRIEDVIDEPRLAEAEDDDDASSVTSVDSDVTAPAASARPACRVPPSFDTIVEIADSDADSDIEILN